MRRLNNRGDTIVEVLIAVIVLSLVLVTAYGVATRSLRDVQQTQEHNQALKVAESQVEALKAYADSGNLLSVGAKTSGFCLNGNTVVTLSGEPTLTTPDTLNTTAYKACAQPFPGGSCTDASGLCYFYGFRYDSANQVYTAFVRWAGLNNGQDQVSLVYRISL